MREKKVRGMKRKLHTLVRRIEENTLAFPTNFYNGYWHLHLPVSQAFIHSSKTPKNIKRLCVQTLLDRAKLISKLKPDDNERYRVMVAVSLPDLWNSQIIVFKGDSHFKGFFNRNNADQKWIPLSKSSNIKTKWGLSVPIDFQILGFQEVIKDEDGYYEGEIWFIGEIK